MNAENTGDRVSIDDAKDKNDVIIQPVPTWIKQGGAALVIIIAISIIWVFATGDDNESQVPLTDVESTDPALVSEDPFKTELDQDASIPIHSSIKLESELYPSDESSLPLVKKNNPMQEQLTQLHDDLTTLILENNQRQNAQDTFINELRSLVSAQELKIEQLQGNLIKIRQVSVKPRKKIARTYKRITLPFTLVSVDQWGNDQYAVIRFDGQLYELTNGQGRNGWEVLLIDRSRGAVTFKNMAGKQKELHIKS